jgi:FKBP-type peptidyl-prolyl cis-trans isomerase
LNKEIAEQEKIDIALYCDRIPNSEFKETGSGLLYWIIKASEGSTALPGDIVQVAYVISFLDGEVCYRTGKDEVKEFRVDKSDVETGIQEAIKLLGEGSKAKLIISSYLAHGLTGDNNKIPPLTPIVVDLEVIRLIKKR